MKNLRLAFKLADLARGTRAEMEHAKTLRKIKRPEVTVREAAQEIAKDHLKEDPAYYEKLEAVESLPKKEDKRLKSPRLKLLGRRGKLRIYLVDATAVRGMTDKNPNAPDFTMGTGDQVWRETTGPWEVWISDELGPPRDPLELRLTMLHEMTERRLMLRDGMSYDEAHGKALALEDKYRKINGRGLKAALARERGQ